MITTRRLSRALALFAVLMLVFSNVSFADSEEPAIVPAPENDTEAIVETEQEEPEEVPEVAEKTKEDISDPEEFLQEDEDLPEGESAAQEPERAIIPDGKSNFELAAERISGRKGWIDLRDLLIPENQEDELLSYLFSNGAFDSDLYEISFYSEGDYMAYCEIDPVEEGDECIEESVSVTDHKPETVVAVDEIASPEHEMEEISDLPPEDEEGTEEPTGSFFCTLIIFLGGATKLIQYLI